MPTPGFHRANLTFNELYHQRPNWRPMYVRIGSDQPMSAPYNDSGRVEDDTVAPIVYPARTSAPVTAGTFCSNGTDEWCRQMRTFPSAQRLYPKVYSTRTLSPLVASVKT